MPGPRGPEAKYKFFRARDVMGRNRIHWNEKALPVGFFFGPKALFLQFLIFLLLQVHPSPGSCRPQARIPSPTSHLQGRNRLPLAPSFARIGWEFSPRAPGIEPVTARIGEAR